MEGVDFEAGVVGEDGEAGAAGGVEEGFGGALPSKVGSSSGAAGMVCEAGEREEGDAGSEGGGEVAELAGVGGGDVEGGFGSPAIVRPDRQKA